MKRYCMKTLILLTGLSALSICSCLLPVTPETTCDKNSDCIEGHLCDKEKKCVQVEQIKPEIAFESLPTGIVNTPYAFSLSAQGGLEPYTWTAETELTWLSLKKETAQDDGLWKLVGTPNEMVSDATVRLTVTDNTIGDGHKVSKVLQMNITYCVEGQENTCSGHGNCGDEGLCSCEPGYFGNQCEDCAEGYELNEEDVCVRYEYQCESTDCGADVQQRECFGDLCREWTTILECTPKQVCLSSQTGAECISCEVGCGNGACLGCTTGSCCDENGQIKASDEVCEQGSEVQCSGSQCGDDVQERDWTRYCNGLTSGCDSDVVTYTEWFVKTDCQSNQFCGDTGGSYPDCIACDHGCKNGRCNECSSGDCCDENGQLKSNDAICKQTTEYRCTSDACGANSQYRSVPQYCSGVSSDCDGAIDDPSWLPLVNCDDNQLCVTDGITTADCETCDYGCNQNVCLVEYHTAQVSAGGHHTCGVKGNNTVYCWGSNSDGQKMPPANNIDFTQVSAGDSHNCGVKVDGTVYCWGANDDGQTILPGDNINFIQVSAGGYHTCGVKVDGTVHCWGRNNHGQATPPGDNINFIQVSAGGYHTCGVKGDGSVHCRGFNNDGRATPPDDNTGFYQVSAGRYHTCGVKSDGTVHCWGSDADGQRTPPGDNTGFTQVSGGTYHTCGVKGNGTVHCWGSNSFGQSDPP